MSGKKIKTKSLSEKISESFIPRSLPDPEVDSEDETAAKFATVDENEDFSLEQNSGFSDIRKRNVKNLSEFSDKYKGEVSSRVDFCDDKNLSSENLSDSESDIADNDDLEQYRKKLKDCQIDSEADESLGTDEESTEEHEKEQDVEEDEDSDYDSPGEGGSTETEGDESQDGESNLLKPNKRDSDIQKGLAVQNQLKIWEKLLEVRIHSQKMLIKANSLPFPNLFEKFRKENENFAKVAQESIENVSSLLDKLTEMQLLLAKQYTETKNLLKPRKRRAHGNNVEAEPPTKIYAALLEENFNNFRSYRNSVMQKWYDRTKILTPGAGNKAHKSSDRFDIVQKIEAVLLNKSDLVKKSQLVKGNYTLFKNKSKDTKSSQNMDVEEDNKSIAEEEVTSPEIYDDTDFYHQQLRELIEYKTNASSNPTEISKQFAELQKLRQKMKKKVDTRASKGRKIRYVVHNKLVNFMAPNNDSEWTEQSKDELYRSLFAT